MSTHRRRTLAEYALALPLTKLRRLRAERQLAVLLAGVVVLLVRIQDLVLDMFTQWLREAVAKSHYRVEQARLRTLAEYDVATALLCQLAEAVLE